MGKYVETLIHHIMFCAQGTKAGVKAVLLFVFVSWTTNHACGQIMVDMTNNNHHIWPHLLAPDPHCSSRTIVSLLSIFVICEIKSGILLTFDGARPRVWTMYYVPCRSWLALSHTRSVWLGKARSHMIHTLVTGLDSRGDQLSDVSPQLNDNDSKSSCSGGTWNIIHCCNFQ